MLCIHIIGNVPGVKIDSDPSIVEARDLTHTLVSVIYNESASRLGSEQLVSNV